MIFESVIPTNEQIETRYAQLEKRPHNISHKLMRYQTSLNNQLSKQMGELIELEKLYTKRA